MFTASDIEQVRVGKYSISTSLIIRAAQAQGFDCTHLPERVVQISNGPDSHYFRGTSLPCNNTVASALACNKYFLRRLLKRENLPSPRTVTLRHPAAWPTILTSTLSFPLVVKPINASHANGATLNITTPHELQQAVARAFAHMKKSRRGNRVLVEKFIAGHDLRFLVIGDRAVSVVMREPAYVIGDGQSTIRQLIHAFNEQWQSKRKYDLPLCPIPIDSEVSRYLTKHKLNLQSVLAANQKSPLRWNANVSTGGRANDVTDLVHPRLKDLAVRVAQLSHLPISGVDILCRDLASPDLTTNNISILEINDSPGFDIHHFPVTGVSRNVAGMILAHIFKSPSQPTQPEIAQVDTLLNDVQITLPTPSYLPNPK